MVAPKKKKKKIVRRKRVKSGNENGKAKTAPKTTRKHTSHKKDKDGLTVKQRLFALEYLKDCNGAHAAIRAGYSEKGASQQASELLALGNVAKFVAKEFEKRSGRTYVSGDRVVRELARLAFMDIRGVMTFGENGIILKNSNELSDDDAASIQSIKHIKNDSGTTLQIKLHSKERALNLLAQHTGIIGPASGATTTEDAARLALAAIQAIAEFGAPPPAEGEAA